MASSSVRKARYLLPTHATLIGILGSLALGLCACGYSIKSGPNVSMGSIFPRPVTSVDVVNNTSCEVSVKLVGVDDVRILRAGATATFRFFGAGDEFVVLATATCREQAIGTVSARFWAAYNHNEAYAWILNASDFRTGNEFRFGGRRRFRPYPRHRSRFMLNL